MLAKRSAGNILNNWYGDDFFGDLFRSLSSPFSLGSTPAEFTENDDNYVLRVELPGLGDDIKVTYDNDLLHISAEKVENNGVKWSTRSYGKIEKTYQLPNVNQDKIEATYSKGVLTVTLGKLTETRPPRKEITVKCCD